MTQDIFNEIPQYANSLKLTFRKNAVKNLIDIPLRVAVKDVANEKSVSVKTSGSTCNIFTVRKICKDQPVALIGEPGAGKTVLLRELARYEFKNKKSIPVFIPMATHDGSREIIDLFPPLHIPPDRLEALLIEGTFTVIWDGVNESQSDNIDTVFEKLIRFTKKYPLNHYFISCRTFEFPEWAYEDFAQTNVLSVPMEEVQKQFIKVLGSSEGTKVYNEVVLGHRHTRIKEMCLNPLLLSMILSIYSDEASRKQSEITSRAKLYDIFLSKLDQRERSKRKSLRSEKTLPAGLKQHVLSLIGYRMLETAQVYSREESVQSWIAEALRKGEWKDWWGGSTPSVTDIFENIVPHPPLNVIEDHVDGSRLVGFMHQSFGEYYAAFYIKTALLDKRLEIKELDAFELDTTRRHWEVISLLCGIIDHAETVTNYIVGQARKFKKQSLLVLAGHCVRDATHISLDSAVDIRLRMMDAFKYSNVSFEYDLIFALKDTLRFDISPQFPLRLMSDVRRYTDKYARVIPAELRQISVDSLKEYITNRDAALAVDAVFTLGRKEYGTNRSIKESVVRFLLETLDSSEGHFREQIIVALKDLSSSLSLNRLTSLVQDESESPRARAYALNGLGSICNLSSVPVVIAYLQKHTNPYRDSASWSLQKLGKKALREDLQTADTIKRAYYQALISETNDEEGRYAKGSILYSLSELNATEYRDRIQEWIQDENDPYVLEDGINAIGALGGDNAALTIYKYLHFDDPAIRMKTAEALGKLGFNKAVKELEDMKNTDPFPILREAAEDALKLLNRGMKSAPMSMLTKPVVPKKT